MVASSGRLSSAGRRSSMSKISIRKDSHRSGGCLQAVKTGVPVLTGLIEQLPHEQFIPPQALVIALCIMVLGGCLRAASIVIITRSKQRSSAGGMPAL